MRFLSDAQLPPGLGERLREFGHEAQHVREIGLGTATDLEIWQRACGLRAVLITKDQDFITIAGDGAPDAAVIWIRLGNTTNRALWQALDPLMGEIVAAIENGERVIEVG